jgi:hypothetical protein
MVSDLPFRPRRHFQIAFGTRNSSDYLPSGAEDAAGRRDRVGNSNPVKTAFWGIACVPAGRQTVLLGTCKQPSDGTIEGEYYNTIADGTIAVGETARVTIQSGEYFVNYGCLPWHSVK